MNPAPVVSRERTARSSLCLALLTCALTIEDGRAAELFAGNYSFSDELGGFRLLSATGVGTSLDPVVVVEEINEAAPVTLVVRRHNINRIPRGQRNAALTLEIVVVNRSRRVWAGFEIELQEILRRPSVYTDGLSFNQLGPRAPDVSSDSFADNDRLFEPHDRIRFEHGFVDPHATARFTITITDPTPDLEFYVVQDPKLLMSEAPMSRGLAAHLDDLGSRPGDAAVFAVDGLASWTLVRDGDGWSPYDGAAEEAKAEVRLDLPLATPVLSRGLPAAEVEAALTLDGDLSLAGRLARGIGVLSGR